MWAAIVQSSLILLLTSSICVAAQDANNPQPQPAPTPTQAPLAPGAPLPPNSTWTTIGYTTFISTLTPGQPVPTSLPATQSVFTVTAPLTSLVPVAPNISSTAPTATSIASIPPSTPVASGPTTMSHSDVPPDDHALPLHITVDPALGFIGALLILTGAPLAFIGQRSRWFICACTGFYSLALIVLCFIMRFGVANAVNETSKTTRGLFALACICGGTIGGALFVVFQQGGLLISTALGGMAVGLYIQACHAGGLIAVVGLRYILYVGFMSLLFTLACAPRLHSYVLIFSSAHTGITAAILGIDCFARVGLKEFYLRNLGFDDLFEKRYPLAFADKRWPLTSAEVIELGMLAGMTLMAMALQTRMWAELRVNLRLMRTQDEERQLQLRAKRAAKEILADAQRDLREWEKRHGQGSSSDGVTETTGPQLIQDEATTQTGSHHDLVRQQSYLENHATSPLPPESVGMSSPSLNPFQRQSPLPHLAGAPAPWVPPYPPGTVAVDEAPAPMMHASYGPEYELEPQYQETHRQYTHSPASQPNLVHLSDPAYGQHRRSCSSPQEFDQHEIAEKERLLEEVRRMRESINQELNENRRMSSLNHSVPDVSKRGEYAAPFANSAFIREKRTVEEARVHRGRAHTLSPGNSTINSSRSRQDSDARKDGGAGKPSLANFRQSTPWMVGDRSRTPEEIAQMATALEPEFQKGSQKPYETMPGGLGDYSDREQSSVNHARPPFEPEPSNGSHHRHNAEYSPSASHYMLAEEHPGSTNYHTGNSHHHGTGEDVRNAPSRSEHHADLRKGSVEELATSGQTVLHSSNLEEEEVQRSLPEQRAKAREQTLSVSELQDRHTARLKAIQRPLSRHLDEEAAVQKAREEWDRRTALERKKQKTAQKQQAQRKRSDKHAKRAKSQQRQYREEVRTAAVGNAKALIADQRGATSNAEERRNETSTGKSPLAEHLRGQKQQSGAARAREWRKTLEDVTAQAHTHQQQ